MLGALHHLHRHEVLHSVVQHKHRGQTDWQTGIRIPAWFSLGKLVSLCNYRAERRDITVPQGSVRLLTNMYIPLKSLWAPRSRTKQKGWRIYCSYEISFLELYRNSWLLENITAHCSFYARTEVMVIFFFTFEYNILFYPTLFGVF